MMKTNTFLHEGDEGDCLYIVGRGSAAVSINIKGSQKILHHYKSGAVLGEMALYTGAKRSASVVIEEKATLYRLEGKQLQVMQEVQAEATSKLHAYIVRLLSEKVNRATRELQQFL